MEKEERVPLYKTGDKIKIVNYGGWCFFNKAHYPEKPKNVFAEDEHCW
ncbi:MAG: hypothetical protein V4721_10305 [Bacteroidota bacterium]